MQLTMLVAAWCVLALAGTFVQANNNNYDSNNQNNAPTNYNNNNLNSNQYNNDNNNYGSQPNNQVHYDPNRGPNAECHGTHCNGANPARNYHSHPAVRPAIYGGRGLYNYRGYARHPVGHNSNRSYKPAPLSLRPIGVIAVKHSAPVAPRYPSGPVRPHGPAHKRPARYPMHQGPRGGHQPAKAPRRRPQHARYLQRPRPYGHSAPRSPARAHKPRSQYHQKQQQQRGYGKPSSGSGHRGGHSQAKKQATSGGY